MTNLNLNTGVSPLTGSAYSDNKPLVTSTDKSKGRIHQLVEKNIYRTGKHSYRVKVGKDTGLCETRQVARLMKKTFKSLK